MCVHDISLTADSRIEGSFSVKEIPLTLLAAEKEEAKAVLILFLKKQGLRHAVATRTINKSDSFIDHLVSRLHSVHKSRYLVGSISTRYSLTDLHFVLKSRYLELYCFPFVRFSANWITIDIAGRELTTLEIRDALIPYLETLYEEYGNLLVDVVESFPNPPIKEKTVATVDLPPVVPVSDSPRTDKKQKAISRVSEIDPDGNLRPNILYLQELGMDLDHIKGVTQRFPSFAYYSLEGKIKPVVEFLLDLGVPKSQIPTILNKRPQLCGISLEENIIPTMAFLENLGVDKTQWAKVIYRFPALLTYSRQKMKASTDFLNDIGLSAEGVGKVLTRWPNIVSFNVEDKLQPTAEYFRSLGVDVSFLVLKAPQTFGLSIEDNLKPVTEFFLERGYGREEVGTMVSKYGALYTFSLTENLIPKWEFFLTMDYSKSELVKFPRYFSYSLEERIKPRYALMKQCGVTLLLNQLLSLSGPNFDKALKAKMKKLPPNKPQNS